MISVMILISLSNIKYSMACHCQQFIDALDKVKEGNTRHHGISCTVIANYSAIIMQLLRSEVHTSKRHYKDRILANLLI